MPGNFFLIPKDLYVNYQKELIFLTLGTAQCSDRDAGMDITKSWGSGAPFSPLCS